MTISQIRPTLITEDALGRQWRHSKSYSRAWSTYYGAEGGGFGSLTWKEDRPVGFDYPDIGFGQKAILVKGLCKVLFRGIIVQIEEAQGDPDTITVTALGMPALFEADVYNRVFRDGRTGQWTTYTEASGSHQPELFNVETNEHLKVTPRRVDFSANDYARLTYSFPFGEEAERIAFDYDLALPLHWPGKLSVHDNSGLLWSAGSTATGSEFLIASQDATFFDVQFAVTTAGENKAEDGTVYGELTNVRPMSKNQDTLTASDVARDVVTYMVDHGISQDKSRIDNIGRALPATVAFDEDQTPKAVLDWCCQFGGTGDKLLAWGVELNDLDRFYLEEQDLTTVKYIIKRTSGLSAQVKGDLTQSTQKIYAVYQDADQQVVRTAEIEATDEIANYGGYFRRGAFEPSGTLDADGVADLLAMEHAESKTAKVTTSFTVSDKVYTATGKAIAVDEVQAGGIVIVDDFRAREATSSRTDYRTQWSSFQLVGVEVDEDQGTARLIPAGDRRSFDQLVARLASE